MACGDVTRRGVLKGATAGALGAYGLSNVPPGVRALDTQSSGEDGLLLGGPEDKGYASAQSTPSLNLPKQSALTIEFWIRHDGTSQENAIVLDKNSKNSEGYQVALRGSGEQPQLDFGYKWPNSEDFELISNRGVPAGTWTHVACTYNGDQQAIYINGELDSTRDDWNGGDVSSNEAPLVLGANSQKNDRFLAGELDEVRIWNTSRELLEIQDNMFTRLSGDEDGLVAYWPFDGSLDDQTNSNNLSTTGSAGLSGRGSFPVPPLLYTRAGDGAVELQWEPRGAEAQDVSEYRLYYGTSFDGSDREQVTTYESGTTSGTVNAANEQVHFFWITAVGGDGSESGFSYPAIAFPSTSPSGRAISFPGDDSYVTFDNRPGFNVPTGTELTIEFWVNHDGESDENAVLIENNETDEEGYQVAFRGTGSGVKIDFGYRYPNSEDYEVLSNGGVPKNQWTHVACTYDGSRQEIYIDGELDAERTDWNGGTVSSNSAPLLLGANNATNDRFFSGQLDQIRIWNTVRTKEQIQETYQSELFGNEEGLFGYWRTCDGENLYGSSGTAMTGRFNNVSCGEGEFDLGNQSTQDDANPSAGDADSGSAGDETPSDGEDGGGSQGTSGPAQDQGTPTPGGGGDGGRGFLFNGEQSVLGFVNETILTVVGIVFSVFGILYQMIGGER